MLSKGQRRLIGWFTVLLLMTPACKQKNATQPENNSNSVTVTILEPTALDPAFLQGANDFQVAGQLFDSLYRVDPETGDAVPSLAIDDNVSPDGLTWTFHLNAKRTFADGSPILATHFVSAWKRILDPATGSPGADALAFLSGAKACFSGDSCDPKVVALDDRTLQVHLETPQPFLRHMLASPRLAPLPSGFDGSKTNPTEIPDTVVSGPYLLRSWTPNVEAHLTANGNNPRGAKAFFDVVHFRFTQSENSAMTWWRSKESDVVIGLVPLSQSRELRGEFPDSFVTAPRRSVFYLLINHQKSALHDPALRRSLAGAVEREALVQQILGSGQLAAFSFLPALYGANGYQPEACSGWDTTPFLDDLSLEILSNASDTLTLILEFIEQNFTRNAQLDVRLRFLEWTTFLSTVKKGDFDLARMSFTGGADPLDFFDNFVSSHPNNMGHYESPRYDAAVAKARLATSRTDRLEAMREAHRLLCNDVAAIPVYFSSQVYLVRSDLAKSFFPDPQGQFDLTTLRPAEKH